MADRKLHGSGKETMNPFFPDETSFEGPNKTIYSPHGSIFESDVSSTNTFEDRLTRTGRIPGKHSNAPGSPSNVEKGRK
jgi:hypothetical protein